MQVVLTLFLGLIMIVSISLQRTYKALPAKELKKLARAGDISAMAIHKAVAYGPSLFTILWLLAIGSSVGFIYTTVQTFPPLLALFMIALAVWLGYVWLPARRTTRLGLYFARWCAPVLAKVVGFLHPFIDELHSFLRRHYPLTVHTGLYDKYDLVELLHRQYLQKDNQIDPFELGIASRALTFGDNLVRDILVPRRVVKSVATTDSIGPILMSELHASGHSRFPVFEVGSTNNIVGTLYLRDLVDAKTGGLVGDTMRKRVCYIHEEQTLLEALQAIIKTKHHLFIVVNSFEEYVGIVTIEDILERIIGTQIQDEFDRYEDMRAVAALIAEKEHKQLHKKQSPEPTVTDE